LSQSIAGSADTDNPEAAFRRDVARALDEIWELRVADEAMAALFRVILKGRRGGRGGADRGHLSE
jgi:hypothetical protein